MQLGSVLRPDDRLQRTQEGRWLGPYTDSVETTDPWGNAYVVNVRYLPGGGYSGKTPHRVLVLSAGPDGVWQTSYRDDTTEAILGDDIGYEVPMPRESGVLIPR
jgi:hypothetical protein